MTEARTHSIRTRLLLIVSSILIFFFLFSSAALYYNTNQTAVSTLKKTAEQDALRIAKTFDTAAYAEFLNIRPLPRIMKRFVNHLIRYGSKTVYCMPIRQRSTKIKSTC